jgi:hypothetical protein
MAAEPGVAMPPVLIRREFWEPLDLLAYVTRVWRGDGRVERVEDDSPERRRFADRAHRAFVEAQFPVARIRTWVNVQIPREGEGYDPGYPHVHQDARALTLVHYIDPGDTPAPLDIFHADQSIETLYPEENMTVFIPNGVLHGVRKNSGTRNRIAMIATAYP